MKNKVLFTIAAVSVMSLIAGCGSQQVDENAIGSVISEEAAETSSSVVQLEDLSYSSQEETETATAPTAEVLDQMLQPLYTGLGINVTEETSHPKLTDARILYLSAYAAVGDGQYEGSTEYGDNCTVTSDTMNRYMNRYFGKTVDLSAWDDSDPRLTYDPEQGFLVANGEFGCDIIYHNVTDVTANEDGTFSVTVDYYAVEGDDSEAFADSCLKMTLLPKADSDFGYIITEMSLAPVDAGTGNTQDSEVQSMNEAENTQDSEVQSMNVAEELTFSDMSGHNYCFSSGAGAWSTDMTINPDGTFSGVYCDSNMGDDAEEYPNGSQYYCEFSGKLAEPKYVDDYTYTMQIESLTLTYPTDTEEIKDGVRYLYCEPYGLSEGTEFYVYLEGTPVSNLPEAYVAGTRGTIGSSWTELPGIGLYNEANKGCFAVFDAE